MQLLSAINGSSFYAEYAASALKDSLGNTITSTYISAVPAGTMNITSFDTDGTNLTGYAGSAFGGAGGGDMYVANLNYDSDNNITGYNSSAFKDSTITSYTGNWNTTTTNFGTSSTTWNDDHTWLSINSANLTSVSSTVSLYSGTGDWENKISGITIDNGTELTINNKVVNISLTSKVDKESGKGLSTNDYVTSAKNFVDSASLVIPSNATSNNQLITNSDLTAALANFGGFVVTSLDVTSAHPDVANPDTKTIYLTKDPNLQVTDPYTEWIFTSASPSTTAWEIIGETTVDLTNYVQIPSTYTASHIATFDSNGGIQDAGVTTGDLVGSISGIKLNGGNELTITNKVVDIPTATYNNGNGTDGIMAAADKVKLDGIATGAEQNVQADWNESDSTSDAYINNKPNVFTAFSGDGYVTASTAGQTVTIGLAAHTATYTIGI